MILLKKNVQLSNVFDNSKNIFKKNVQLSNEFDNSKNIRQ